jgi:hypothetical protein
MAALDYAGFVTRILQYQASDSTDTDLATIMPSIIGDAELRCYRDLDPLYCRKSDVTITLSAGTATASYPSDCWIPRRMILLSGTTRAALQPCDPSLMDEYWPDRTLVGAPKYYATTIEGTLLLAPTPSAGYSILCSYTYRPATLSASNTTTWLATNYPDLFFYAAIVWLSGFNKAYGGEDPQGPGYWARMYQGALDAARIEESLKRGMPPLPPPPVPTMPVAG